MSLACAAGVSDTEEAISVGSAASACQWEPTSPASHKAYPSDARCSQYQSSRPQRGASSPPLSLLAPCKPWQPPSVEPSHSSALSLSCFHRPGTSPSSSFLIRSTSSFPYARHLPGPRCAVAPLLPLRPPFGTHDVWT